MTTRTVAESLITVNTGSSSVKAAVYDRARLDRSLLSVQVDRIHDADAALCISAPDGTVEERRTIADTGFEAALTEIANAAAGRGFDRPIAVGHRVVHGGRNHARPQTITTKLIAELRELVPVDPEHVPQALIGVETMRARFPEALQVACFDTAFHRDMPPVAQLYGLPYGLAEDGVLRYGFHGLSYESILIQLRVMGAIPEKLIVAHLGNGSSMAAVLEGRSVDTTMGFSPTSGLIMGTRSGDVDPSAVLYLQETRGMAPADLRRLLNRESGLLGMSGTSSDMRSLLETAADDPRAELAIELYCYAARRYVGSMAAALGGLDMLVFTGGIGEHGAEIRRRICSGLGFLGLSLDGERNAAHAPVISRPGSAVVRVMHTDEETVIARHTAEILKGKDETTHVHL